MNVQAKKVAHLKGHDGAVYHTGQSPHANAILSAGSDRMVVEWSLDSFQAEHVLARTPGVIYCTCLIPEFNLLLVGNDQGGIHVIDLTKKAEVRYLLGHSKGVYSIAWNPLTEQVYSCGGDGHFVSWNVHDFHAMHSLVLSEMKIRNCAISPSQEVIAIGTGEGNIVLLSSKSLATVHQWKAHEQSVNAVCFHPNGKWLLSGAKDAHLNCWEIENNFELNISIPAHNYAIYSIVFHPNEKLFATGSRDKTIKLWNSDTLDFLLRIENSEHQGHINSVNSLYWSTYNNYLISGSDDRSLMVWETEVNYE
jgi:WD40 repeat protein